MAARAQYVPGRSLAFSLAAKLTLPCMLAVIFHAVTAAHVRRTNVTFAVALQCEAALAHGASDLHTSMFARKSRLSEPGTPGSQHGSPGSPQGGQAEDEAEAAETFAFRGRRFAAPGLATAAASFFGGESLQQTIVRPLLRSPLLAALGGAGHKGQDATSIAARRKPKGHWKRFKRALHAELAWHKRAWHHAARSIKRCLTPRFRADTRAAGRGVGHAFRVVPAGEWLGEAAPPTAALFEVCVQFGWHGRLAAAAFRDSLRDADHLRALENGFAACVAAAEAAQDLEVDLHDAPPVRQVQQPNLGVRHAGIAIVALLDDEPFARLDARMTRKLAGPQSDVAAAPKSNELGLSPPVAERLATMMLLSMKRKDLGSRRFSLFGRRSQAETPRSAEASGDPATRGDELFASLAVQPVAQEASPVQEPLDTVAADVDAWHLSPRALEAEASEPAAEAEADEPAEPEAAHAEVGEAGADAEDEEAPMESTQHGGVPAEPEQDESAGLSPHFDAVVVTDEPAPEVELASQPDDEHAPRISSSSG